MSFTARRGKIKRKKRTVKLIQNYLRIFIILLTLHVIIIFFNPTTQILISKQLILMFIFLSDIHERFLKILT